MIKQSKYEIYNLNFIISEQHLESNLGMTKTKHNSNTESIGIRNEE